MKTERAKYLEILTSFTQGECPNIAAQPVPRRTEDNVEILQDALTTARAHQNWAEAVRINKVLMLLRFNAFDMFAARREAEEAISLLNASGNVSENRACVLDDLATINLYAGEATPALAYSNEAIQLAMNEKLPLMQGYFLCTVGAIQCYAGQYPSASQSFAQARQLFLKEENGLGIAWWQYLQACEQDRDQGNYGQMAEHLHAALPVLREKTTPKIVIETLFGLADAYLHQPDALKAKAHLDEAEHLLVEGKHHWYRPKLYLLKAQLALVEKDNKLAAQHVHKGLSMVGDQGDLRTLSPLYRLLAAILQSEHTPIDSVLNALERAIAAGRTRARRLDLALALKDTGTCMKVFSTRATARARGSGFLFEAEQLLTEMGLPTG